jgi:hypothetical protein
MPKYLAASISKKKENKQLLGRGIRKSRIPYSLVKARSRGINTLTLVGSIML